MRVDEMLDVLETLRNEHGNCYVMIDSDYIGEVNISRIEATPYAETKYIIIKG